VRRAQLQAIAGKAGVFTSWAIFSYFILVYGLKMYTNVGKGSELDFITEWCLYMLLDNFVLSWSTSFKNATLRTTMVLIIAHFAMLLDPFIWFEAFDDDVMHDSLDDDVAEDLEDFDDLEGGVLP